MKRLSSYFTLSYHYCFRLGILKNRGEYYHLFPQVLFTLTKTPAQFSLVRKPVAGYRVPRSRNHYRLPPKKPRPWRPNRIFVGQSPGSDDSSFDAHWPRAFSQATLSSAATPNKAPSQPSSASSSALSEPVTPRTVSGTFVTRPYPHSDTGRNHAFTEPSFSARRGVQRAFAELVEAL